MNCWKLFEPDAIEKPVSFTLPNNSGYASRVEPSGGFTERGTISVPVLFFEATSFPDFERDSLASLVHRDHENCLCDASRACQPEAGIKT